ncbi:MULTISPECIES: hypothetical protein [Brevibacterium]|uniref:Activator of Hsp90 ATPase homolog 1-like protein n=1 Tax=Brevibacterium casei TaxID=33889 RepID=A0A7T4DJZ8_9MICO|nr:MULTISPECIES: hypothetical protein [Brevibacterium]QQB14314.1 hypothetical protein I6H47_16490 [Brevibacterium casei]
MIAPDPRLVTWENGTDLVIELPLTVTPAAAWARLTDGERAGDWFAPFTVDGDSVSFDLGVSELGQTELVGEILSCEDEEHVLVEFVEFGVLGIQLLPVAVDAAAASADPSLGPEAATVAAADETDGTVLVFTQSATDAEAARQKAADFGPMWDTHLRMFARSLGVEAPEADDDDLLRTYADLELEVDDAAEDDLGDPDLDDLGTAEPEDARVGEPHRGTESR